MHLGTMERVIFNVFKDEDKTLYEQELRYCMTQHIKMHCIKVHDAMHFYVPAGKQVYS